MAVRKRSISIKGHRTSFSIEDAFFDAIATLAQSRALSLAALIAQIDEERARDANLSSAIRLFVLAAAKDGQLNPIPKAETELPKA